MKSFQTRVINLSIIISNFSKFLLRPKRDEIANKREKKKNQQSYEDEKIPLDVLKILDVFSMFQLKKKNNYSPLLNEFNLNVYNELESFVNTFLRIMIRFRKLNLLMSGTISREN